MSHEIIFKYRMSKLYLRFAVMLVSLLVILYAFSTIEEWTIPYVLITILVALITIFYAFKKAKQLSSLDYYLKIDRKGVYTKEAFDFCEWNKIESISLQRYMGYQTLYFELKEDALKSKIAPIKKEEKFYYCLPLADCKEKSSVVFEKVNNHYNLFKK